MDLEVGSWVRVSFRNRSKAALVMGLDEEFNGKFKVLSITGRLDFYPMDPKQLELMKWMANYYVEDLNNLLNLFYPKYIDALEKEKVILGDIELTKDGDYGEHTDLLKYVKRYGPVLQKSVEKKFGKDEVKKLLDLGWIKGFDELDEISSTMANENAVLEERLLTEDQQNIKDKISVGKAKFHLIHGVTGSGKTEIYASLMREAIKEGKGAIFLLPEISLTTQFIMRFKKEFGDNVAVIHSQQTPKERRLEWIDIFKDRKKIVLGVRSAIFSPLKNLKYIILDEEHESSYKQESSPRYDTKSVAIKRVILGEGKVVFGSATPSIESYFHGQSGTFELHNLDKRYMSRPMPDVKVVDMKKEPKQILSKDLLTALEDRLAKGEQAIVIVSRKGFSSSIQCESCGNVEECINCSISLVAHKKAGVLRCHYCDYEKKLTNQCSKCGLFNLHMLGYGTERVLEEMSQHFPKAKSIRVDGDLSRDDCEKAYSSFLEGKYDIMVGTKLIAKGFHFPNVTLVGIIDGDSLLYFPDFRASERAFQLITQASGRSGRESKKGEVVLQSYVPDNHVVEFSKNGDYVKLYEEEIGFREGLGYPPFGKIINLIISSENEKQAYVVSQKLYASLKKYGAFKPTKAPIFIINRRYRFHIFIRSSRSKIDSIKGDIRANIANIKGGKVRVMVDVDPISFL